VSASVRSITVDQAPQHFGFLAGLVGLDNPVSNDKTRALLGWEPTNPGWVEDVSSGHYIDDPSEHSRPVRSVRRNAQRVPTPRR
jgi:hypothetical protein